eukprot:3883100-Rhodomonas_salina.3
METHARGERTVRVDSDPAIALPALRIVQQMNWRCEHVGARGLNQRRGECSVRVSDPTIATPTGTALAAGQ